MLILGFILGKLKKVTRWHCCWKILKRLIKVVITPLLSQLQGWPGWQKNGTMLRYLHLVVFCAKIEPKIEKIQKTIRKQGFFDDFLSILTVFWSLLNFGSILAQKLNRFICEKKNWIFWHPGHPWSCESSGVGKIRALSDTVTQWNPVTHYCSPMALCTAGCIPQAKLPSLNMAVGAAEKKKSKLP